MMQFCAGLGWPVQAQIDHNVQKTDTNKILEPQCLAVKNQNNYNSNWKKLLGFRILREKLEKAMVAQPQLATIPAKHFSFNILTRASEGDMQSL